MGEREPWASGLTIRSQCVGIQRLRQRGAHGQSAKALDAALALLQVKRAGTEIPVQQLATPDVKVQSFLPERRGGENVRPERRIEGTPEVVRAQVVLVANALFALVSDTFRLGVRKWHSRMTSQVEAVPAGLVDLMTPVAKPEHLAQVGAEASHCICVQAAGHPKVFVED